MQTNDVYMKQTIQRLELNSRKQTEAFAAAFQNLQEQLALVTSKLAGQEVNLADGTSTSNAPLPVPVVEKKKRSKRLQKIKGKPKSKSGLVAAKTVRKKKDNLPESNESNDSAEEDYLSDDEEGSYASARSQVSFGLGDDIVYIRELMLDLCSDPLDQLRCTNTSDEAPLDYIRLQATNGFLNTLWSNHLSYSKFLHGFYICGFDLTCANEGAKDSYSIPSVRQGANF